MQPAHVIHACYTTLVMQLTGTQLENVQLQRKGILTFTTCYCGLASCALPSCAMESWQEALALYHNVVIEGCACFLLLMARIYLPGA